MEAKLNRSIFKDPIQVGDKVLLHRPQSATAHLSHLPWIGDFEVTKTNGLVVQVKNENCETHWIHRGHVRRLVPRPKWPATHAPTTPHLQLYPHLTKFPITRRHDHSYLLVHPGNLPITRYHNSLHFRQGSILSQMTAVSETIPKTQRNEQHEGNSQHALKTSLCAKKQNK